MTPSNIAMIIFKVYTTFRKNIAWLKIMGQFGHRHRRETKNLWQPKGGIRLRGTIQDCVPVEGPEAKIARAMDVAPTFIQKPASQPHIKSKGSTIP